MSKIRIIEKTKNGKEEYFFSLNDTFNFLEVNNVLTVKQFRLARWNAQEKIYKKYVQGFSEGEINTIDQADYMLLEFNDLFVNPINLVSLLAFQVPVSKLQNKSFKTLCSFIDEFPLEDNKPFGFSKEEFYKQFKIIGVDLDAIGFKTYMNTLGVNPAKPKEEYHAADSQLMLETLQTIKATLESPRLIDAGNLRRITNNAIDQVVD